MSFWLPILDPSLAPFPTGVWGAGLRGSFVSRTLRGRLWFDCLPIPVLSQELALFVAMILLNCKSTTRASSLAFLPLREQTTKSVSVSCDSAYRYYPFLLFPTGMGALPLVHTFNNPIQRHQVWHQWWLQLGDPINPRSSRPPAFLCTCHCPDVSLARICYGPDGLGVRPIKMLRWRNVKLRNNFVADFLWHSMTRPSGL